MAVSYILYLRVMCSLPRCCPAVPRSRSTLYAVHNNINQICQIVYLNYCLLFGDAAAAVCLVTFGMYRERMWPREGEGMRSGL